MLSKLKCHVHSSHSKWANSAVLTSLSMVSFLLLRVTFAKSLFLYLVSFLGLVPFLFYFGELGAKR